MKVRLNPLIGVLLIFILAPIASAIDTPGEILIEIDDRFLTNLNVDGDHTGVADLDLLLSSYPNAITRLAIENSDKKHERFRKYLLIRLPQQFIDRRDEIVQKIKQLGSVRWARPNPVYTTHFYPDDPEFDQQWGANRIRVQDAWDITFGSIEIPIAIIDTGCEMDHPDLIGSFWVNEGELPGNGIDDDGNGYIDDLHGWDFVDAPAFPTGGDYLERDNDPSDEMGHGTTVAGICGATIDNGIGVAGVAPDCPIMVLRAGNANGYLQEDDVASALLYAMDNGARIVNMSFGDVQASPMLNDAIEYASLNGLIMVAAAGNNGSSVSNYPAAFSPVLCVGSCTSNNTRAWDSNYGTALDLLAPGVEIYSTLLGHEYGLMPPSGSGTSFASPHAAGVAGLILALHPQWDPSEVISVMKASTDDIPPAGWDPQTGQGILRADLAVQVDESLVAEIHTPKQAQGYVSSDTIRILGTASGVYFDSFDLLWGEGENPDIWESIQTPSTSQVVGGLLGSWTDNLTIDTLFTIRLIVHDIFGNQVDDRVVIHYDATPPVISNVTVLPIIDGDRPSYLLTFNTDDRTRGRIWLNEIGQEDKWLSQVLEYETTEHIFLIGKNVPYKEYGLSIWVENSSGLIDSTDILDTLDLTNRTVNLENLFVEMPSPELPLCKFYEETTDLDQDDLLEIWLTTFDENGGLGSLKCYEANSSWTFTDLNLDFGREIPKSIGDSDADGFVELLTTYAGNSKIFEAAGSDPFPDPENIAWADNSGDQWGARLLDIEPNDGYGEVILESDKTYHLYRNMGNGQLPYLQALASPFSIPLVNMPPYCRVNDYDHDGYTDLLFGDHAGNLYIYEEQGNGTFAVSWQASLLQLDSGEYLCDGDFDGDGEIEFCVLTHTETTLTGEHQADSRYWVLHLFNSVGDNQYTKTDSLYFFGAENASDFASGINSGDILDDSQPEIILNLYPDLYIVDWIEGEDRYDILWYYPESRSNKSVVGDFNRNGHNEFLFNTGAEVKGFEEVGDWSPGLPPPLVFEATSPDTVRVFLSWSSVTGAHEYNLFRGQSPDDLSLLIALPDYISEYEDFAVIKDTTYYYAIATFKLGSGLGPLSNPIAATPNEPPFVIGNVAQYSPPGFVSVQFSEPMNETMTDVGNYRITNTTIQPSSIVSDAGDTRAILTFDAAFGEGAEYPLSIHELFDQQGSSYSNVINPDTLRFYVPPATSSQPYLVTAYGGNDNNRISVVFSEAMRSNNLEILGNYQLEVDDATGVSSPDPIVLIDATADDNLQNIVRLTVSPQTPIGAMGKIYRITVTNVHNLAGTVIDGDHNSVALSFSQTNLQRVFAYPNPYKYGKKIDGEDCIIFANLTPDAEIKILNLSGICIRTLSCTSNITGGLKWYVDNDRGERVGSGIYIYQVTGNGDSFWGKLAVVR